MASGHNVYHQEFNKLRSVTKLRFGKLYKKVFNEEMMDFGDEIMFWVQDRTQIISMGVLNLKHPIDLLKYPIFHSTSPRTVALIHSVGTDEKYRQQGCSTSIFREIIKFINSVLSSPIEVFPEVFLEVLAENRSAISLYTKLDFHFVYSPNDVENKEQQATIFEDKIYYLMNYTSTNKLHSETEEKKNDSRN